MSSCKHIGEEKPVKATGSDYEDYFGISEAIPGTEAWRQDIYALVDEIVIDFKRLGLCDSDAATLISGLLSVSKLSSPQGLRQESRS
jgi:hypothetical protein